MKNTKLLITLLDLCQSATRLMGNHPLDTQEDKTEFGNEMESLVKNYAKRIEDMVQKGEI